jgi:hypothetical protein
MQQTILGSFKGAKEDKIIVEPKEHNQRKVFLPWVEK